MLENVGGKSVHGPVTPRLDKRLKEIGSCEDHGVMSGPRVVFDHTDPGLRPFIEVGAKIVLDVFDEARRRGAPAQALVANVADTSTADAAAGAKEMSEQVPSTRRLLPVCNAGCSYCCHGLVPGRPANASSPRAR